MEKWVDIEEFKGLYQVSDLGNVRSLERKIYTRLYPSQLMRKYPHKVGENIRGERVHLRSPKKCGQVQRSVAKLVLLSFKGEPPKNSKQVIHIDGNPLNNSLDNLKWDVDKSYGLPENKEARELFNKYIYKYCKIIVCKYKYYNFNFGLLNIDDLIQIVACKVYDIIDCLDLSQAKTEDDKKRHFYCFVRKKFRFVRNSLLKKELNINKVKIYTFSEYNSMVGEDYDIENKIGIEDKYNFDNEINLKCFSKKYNLDYKYVEKIYNRII